MSCSDRDATAIVVLYSAEPRVKTTITQVEISAYRTAQPSFVQSYDVPADMRFPSTLTFSKKEEAPASQAVLYKIVGKDASGMPRIDRQARLGFVGEHTKLLKMTLEDSCLDHEPCQADQTCVDGMCVNDSIDPGGLPDFTSNGDVLASGGAAGEAGVAGSSGNNGASGSSGSAGTGGMTGSAGEGGMAGTSGVGGSGGTSGSSGTMGSGGTGGISGTGGTGGTAGTGGTGGIGGNPVVGCDTPSTGADGSISLTASHGCAVLKDHTVSCWGDRGSTGVISNDPTPPPYDAIATHVPLPATSQYKRVSTSTRTDCALDTDGKLTCWGDNYYGTLATANVTDSLTVAIAANVIDFVIGPQHACAIVGASPGATEGEVKCWGTNSDGGIGVTPDGTAAAYATPQMVAGVTGVASATRLAVDPGGGLTCALLSNGAVMCWGGDTNHWHVATAVAAGAQEISLGDPTVLNRRLFFRDATNMVYSVQRDTSGTWSAPVLVPNLGAVTNIHSDSTLCGVDASDPKTLRCTAFPLAASPAETPRTFSSPIKGVAVGHDLEAFNVAFECVTLEDGSAHCRGNDFEGMLGIGKPDNVRIPLLVDLQGASVVSLATSYASTAVQTSDGFVWAWGRNKAFFGDQNIHAPTKLGFGAIPENVTISMAPECDAAYLVGPTERRLYVNGQEDTTSRLFADPSFVPSSFEAIVAGASIDLAVTASGVRAYGTNDATNASHLLPLDTTTGTEHQTVLTGQIAEIAYRSDRYYSDTGGHGCVRLQTGEVQCWGTNTYGESGSAPISPTIWPPSTVKLASSTPISAVSLCSGQYHSCAATASGEVYCWGDNDALASEPNAPGAPNTATPVLAMTLASAGPYHVSCGTYNTCAWTSSEMWCWGYNNTGQVGDPAVDYVHGATLTKVTHMPPEGSDAIEEVSVSELHVCAIVSARGATSVACWGGNVDGAVGIGPNGFFDEFQSVCSLDSSP